MRSGTAFSTHYSESRANTAQGTHPPPNLAPTLQLVDARQGWMSAVCMHGRLAAYQHLPGSLSEAYQAPWAIEAQHADWLGNIVCTQRGGAVGILLV